MRDRFLTYEGVLRELQIEENELDRLVLDGQLNPVAYPDGLRFPIEEVMNFKEEREGMQTIVLDIPEKPSLPRSVAPGDGRPGQDRVPTT